VRRGLAVLLTALALLVSGCGSQAGSPSAADQVPALGTALQRIDAALASHHFAAARQRLRALKTAVISARKAGDLRAADAQRVLDAAARLLATLPADDAQPTETSSPTGSATTGPSRPASKHPAASQTPDPTPTAVTSSAPSSSPTPTPSPAPSPTAGSSPTGAPTSTQ
jgi:hypothetical protein